MTTEQWKRVKALFHEAVEREPGARRTWLDGLDSEDAEVRDEVRALLRAHDSADGFLDQPALVPAEDPPELAPAEEAAAAAVRPGVRIGDYEIRREIGRGGMGVVYLAQDVHLARPAAIKAVPAELATDPARLERLRREAQAAAAIAHPGVAMVYAFVTTPHGHFIASEYIEGRTLRAELQQGPIETARALRIAIEIVEALCAAHDAGVVHRDLKPENVLITPGGRVKLIDFGIARRERLFETGPILTGAIQGTPAYMAPEQLVPGVRVDGRADIYALGVILAEMVLGRHPLGEGAGRLPDQLQVVVRRCLETDPARRFHSARDLLHELEQIQLHLSGTMDVAPLPQADPAAPRWWWQFHQVLAAVVYWFVMVPAWYARELIGGPSGRALFFVALGASLVASILRLHLWFTSRTDPGGFPGHLRAERTWVVAADLLFGSSLAALGVLVGDARMSLAVALVTAGVGSAVVSLFVEPATARAAFPTAGRSERA